jgi:prepilin-type processing-associated H-X9-DG protein
MNHILPYIEQDALYKQLPLIPKDATNSAIYGVPINDASSTQVPIYLCPSDPRGYQVYPGSNSYPAWTFTSYAAVGGIDAWSDSWPMSEGMIYWRSRHKITDVADGTSNTLAAGERPWNDTNLTYGSYASLHRYGTFRSAEWEYDTVQYMANSDVPAPFRRDDANRPCPLAPFYPGIPNYKVGQTQNLFGPGRTNNPCSFNHFWSPHLGGANFVFGDGSVRFLPYSAKPVMNILTTRAHGDLADASAY